MKGFIRKAIVAVSIGLTLSGGGAAVAAEPLRSVRFDIPAQSLEGALLSFSKQAGIQLVVADEAIRGLKTAGIQGEYSTADALSLLLQGSGLSYRMTDVGTIAISGDKNKPVSQAPIKMTMARVPAQSEPAVQAEGTAASTSNNTASEAEVVVTGSHIRRATSASPTITLDQEAIRAAGHHELGEVLRSLPQNFSGGQNPGVTGNTGVIANQNISGGSTVNLRGLGPDTTLTLMNGRRLSYGTFIQAVDISAIPLAAVDNIQIVTDGASAIYGSDAVGGVVNVRLKRDYDGVSLTARRAGTSDGGDSQSQYSVVAGTTWQGGGLIAVHDYEEDQPIYTDRRDFTRNIPSPTTLLPYLEHHSSVLSAHQNFGERVEFSIDGLYNKRQQRSLVTLAGLYGTNDPKVKSYSVAPALTLSLPRSWALSAYGVYSKDETTYDQRYVAVPSGASLGAYSGCYCNTLSSVDLSAEGPLFSFRGNEVRAAVGGGRRKNEYREFSFSSTSRTGGEQESSFAYGELDIPVVVARQALRGVHRLNFNAAARYESYAGGEEVTTPKLGVIYAPSANLEFSASWGKSFKAPTLLQQFQPFYVFLGDAATYGGAFPSTATALNATGGNPDLKPEHATTVTVGVKFTPESIPDLQLGASYFDIQYKDRVALPITGILTALSDPTYQQFITLNPALAQQQAVIARATGGFYNDTASPYDPANVVAILNNAYINISKQDIDGFDLNGRYRLNLGADVLTFQGDASWLWSTQQISPAAAVLELAGTTYDPPRWRGRVGAAWERGTFKLSGFVNYTDGVRDPRFAAQPKTDAMTTIDLTALYGLKSAWVGMNGIDISFSVQNLTNEAPPYLAPPTSTAVSFDSTNYSGIGRFLSLAATLHF